ncbi:hypothetical protein B0I37DRAFT_235947 [Chaetomium sp. MPI-CAGE-AT-0009]|nr:hypothetical protein B0I37DRAFT_235947 [Chaetomium sp. MPI-CAGE-AT-0009]
MFQRQGSYIYKRGSCRTAHPSRWHGSILLDATLQSRVFAAMCRTDLLLYEVLCTARHGQTRCGPGKDVSVLCNVVRSNGYRTTHAIPPFPAAGVWCVAGRGGGRGWGWMLPGSVRNLEGLVINRSLAPRLWAPPRLLAGWPAGCPGLVRVFILFCARWAAVSFDMEGVGPTVLVGHIGFGILVLSGYIRMRI